MGITIHRSIDVKQPMSCSKELNQKNGILELENTVKQLENHQQYGIFLESITMETKFQVKLNENTIFDVYRGYTQQGKKQGLWMEKILDFSKKVIAFKVGEYVDNIRQGKWKYYINYDEIGGGYYNQQGIKTGKWTELSEFFLQNSIFICNGDYKEGKKIGVWDFSFKSNNMKYFKSIGCGSYDERGNGLQTGKWAVLASEFNSYSFVIQTGEFNNGKKVGRWDFFESLNKIGGGFYDGGEDCIKIGYWMEISKWFDFNKQVFYEGKYQNGKKVGYWNILQRGSYNNNKYKIGGGLYDEGELGLKIGNWFEISDELQNPYVRHEGVYINGKKVGSWDIHYIYNRNDKIGGGSFDEDNTKIGLWIELDELFNVYRQVICDGEYQQGVKIGRWNFQYREQDCKTFNKIGGGLYDKGIKIGDWIELSEKYKSSSQVTYKGEYINGKKFGRWDIYWNWLDNKKIGGGTFDEDNTKIGFWIELDEQFDLQKQVIYDGEYQHGIKIGRWNFQYRETNYSAFKTIGGGLYDKGIKIGNWIELSEEFIDNSQIIYNGEYKNGNKVGRWGTQYRVNIDNPFQKIGGGVYDGGVDCIKIGHWIDICEGFFWDKQIIYNGKYQNGRKYGNWMEFQRDFYNMKKGFQYVKDIICDY